MKGLLLLVVVCFAHAAASSTTRKLSGASYVALKALADEYGVPCAPQHAQLLETIKDIRSKNAERLTTLEVDCEFREGEAQGRFTNATTEAQALNDAARRSSEERRRGVADKAQAQFDGSVAQLRATVDAAGDRRDASLKTLGSEKKAWAEAQGARDNTLEMCATNKESANQTRVSEMAALVITQSAALDDAEASYVVRGCGRG